MFDGLINAGVLNNTEWTGIEYRAGMFTFYRMDEETNTKVKDNKPFCFGFSLSAMEHDKSTSYDGITTILFDEFLTRKQYLLDEFTLFMNCLSTIIRYRDNVKIYMCANTVNFSAPYFGEFGLKHIRQMKKGTIDVYQYGEDGSTTLAVEYCGDFEGNKQKKPSDKYFAFDNPKLKMITGGDWEMSIYPHLPMKYKPKDVRRQYFIQWEEDILHCEIIKVGNVDFTFIHKKTTAIKDEDKDLIFSPTADPRRNWRRNILCPYDKIGEIIKAYFVQDKVYYQNNEIGEIVRNYLNYCKSYSIIRA